MGACCSGYNENPMPRPIQWSIAVAVMLVGVGVLYYLVILLPGQQRAQLAQEKARAESQALEAAQQRCPDQALGMAQQFARAEGYARAVAPSNHYNHVLNTCVACFTYVSDNIVTSVVLNADENKVLARCDSGAAITGGIVCLQPGAQPKPITQSAFLKLRAQYMNE